MLFSLSRAAGLALALLWLGPVAPRAEAAGHSGTMIGLNDFGTADVAYLTLPSREPRGGLVFVPDAWGLTEAAKGAVDRLAQEGYVVVAPDLLNGQTTSDPQRAADFTRALDHASAVKTILAAARCLRESPRFRTKRLALVGWGLGGTLALETATGLDPKKDPAIDAVAVVGLPLPATAKFGALGAPLLAVFHADDSSSEARQGLADALELEKKPLEIHVLDPKAKLSAVWGLFFPFLDRTFTAPPQPKAEVGRIFDDLNPFHDAR